MTVPSKTLVLTTPQVHQKIKRIAYEMLENNFSEKELVLAGVEGQGYHLAELLKKELENVGTLSVQLVKLTVDKSATSQPEIQVSGDLKKLRKKCVVLVDDVLNTGRTLAYSLHPFLKIEMKKLQVAVLVNRSHSQYPIQPTFTGFELSTTLNDHVEVVLGKQAAVYLK
jgi:pyrimidine operon attenuation protein / uracil phosphoribosyltransferase